MSPQQEKTRGDFEYCIEYADTGDPPEIQWEPESHFSVEAMPEAESLKTQFRKNRVNQSGWGDPVSQDVTEGFEPSTQSGWGHHISQDVTEGFEPTTQSGWGHPVSQDSQDVAEAPTGSSKQKKLLKKTRKGNKQHCAFPSGIERVQSTGILPVRSESKDDFYLRYKFQKIIINEFKLTGQLKSLHKVLKDCGKKYHLLGVKLEDGDSQFYRPLTGFFKGQ